MGKGGRSYIPVTRNSQEYKIFISDVKTWRQISKKKTPRLPAYDQKKCLTLKWEEITDI